MSNHVWTQENIAAYVAGGLEPAEGERLEQHAAECAACARALDEARALEDKLHAAFAGARPGAALEDVVIQALPQSQPPRTMSLRLSRRGKLILGAAAAVLLAFSGAGISVLLEQQRLGFPTATPFALRTPGKPTVYQVAKSHDAEPAADPQVAAEGIRIESANGSLHNLAVPDARQKKGAETWKDLTDGVLKSADDLAKEVRESTVSELSRAKNVDSPFWKAPSGAGGPAEHFGSLVSPSYGLPSPPKQEPSAKVLSSVSSSTPPAASRPVSGSGGGGAAGPGAGIPGPQGGFGAGGGRMFGPVSAGAPAGAPAIGLSLVPPQTTGLSLDGRKEAGAEKKSTELLYFYQNADPAPLQKDYFKPGDDFARVLTAQTQNFARLGTDADKDKALKQLEDLKKADLGVITDRLNAIPAQQETGKTKPPQKPPAEKAPEAAPRRIIIRTGELEFEIESFDASVSTIMKLVTATRGGFVATINSDKLANGKVRGAVVVRIPPEQLDKFVLDLRQALAKTGELKNQRIGSQDITKQYTDLESRLRAARSMEERLLRIIKDGKGQIKDLLQAEKELGVWRTKIEEMEGEIRYYNNMASYSTLTINLSEKNIRTAALITENERVQAGIEVDDVEKAHQEALKAITDAKGRVSRSELKQHAAGQFNAILHFEVAPESAGPIRDRLKQLGNLVRLQIDRIQATANGAPAPKDGKIERGPTQFLISIYNLANVAPRETVLIRIAAGDVPAVYQKLRLAIAKAKGHVVNSQLNEQDKHNINAQLDFNVRRAGEADILQALTAAGETLTRQVSRVPESDNVTDSKVLYRITLVDSESIPPRETQTVKVAATDVPGAYRKLKDAITKLKVRIFNAQLNEQDRRNISGNLDFAFRRGDEGTVQAAMAEAGETLSRFVTRVPESPNVTDARVLAKVELIDATALPPRETVVLRIAAVDVPDVYQKLRDAITKAEGRVANAQLNEQDRRNVTASLSFDVPRKEENAVRTALAEAGEALTRKVTRQQENINVTDTRVSYQVDLTPAAAIPPRETTTLALEVNDVSGTLSIFNADAKDVQGRIVETQVGQERNGQISARVVYDVPFSVASGLVEKFKNAGHVRVHQVTRDPQAPEGKLALARIAVTVSNTPLLVPTDQSLLSQVRNGLAFSLRGLSISASWLIVGILFILPWALLVYVIIWLARRMWTGTTVAAATPVASVPLEQEKTE